MQKSQKISQSYVKSYKKQDNFSKVFKIIQRARNLLERAFGWLNERFVKRISLYIYIQGVGEKGNSWLIHAFLHVTTTTTTTLLSTYGMPPMMPDMPIEIIYPQLMQKECYWLKQRM